ncbi:MAG: ribosome assembly cofactor RimP [Bacteroidaceae bacterium]|nr:ribosome assembly cofactor RimP [Bacteroidaceae bacterium]
MIEKKYVESVVNEWLEGRDYFLVDVTVSADDCIVVTIDHAEGVWIEDCAELSRFIESRLNRDEEDFELEVGSAGLGQPFQVKRQWEIHVGEPVETQTRDGHKYQGTLTEVTDDGFTMEVETRVKPEGAKRPRKELVGMHFTFDEVAWTKYLIKVK